MGRKRLNLVLPLSELLIFAGTPKNHKGSALSLQMAGQHPGPGIAGRQGWIQPEGWQTRSRNMQSSRSSREHNCVHFSLAGSWFITLTLAMQVAAAVRTGGVCKGKWFHQDMTGDGVARLGPNLVQVPLACGASYPIAPSCPWLLSAMQMELFPRLAFPVTWIFCCEGWCNLHHQHLSQVPLCNMGPFHAEVQSFDVAVFSPGWTKPRFGRFN